MRMLLNGVEGNQIAIFKDGETVLKLVCTDDSGAIRAQAASTITLELYDDSVRTNTPTSLAAAYVTASAGYSTVTISEVALAALQSGKSYYAFAKEVTTGTVTSFSNTPALLFMT